jgi:hypothetical protein
LILTEVYEPTTDSNDRGMFVPADVTKVKALSSVRISKAVANTKDIRAAELSCLIIAIPCDLPNGPPVGPEMRVKKPERFCPGLKLPVSVDPFTGSVVRWLQARMTSVARHKTDTSIIRRFIFLFIKFLL